MTPADMQAVIEGVTEGVAEHIGELSKALAAANERIALLEQRSVVNGKDGADGKDADMPALMAAIDEAVTKAMAAVPLPKDGVDGKDADPVDLDALAAKAAALIPIPKDGADGKDAEPVDLDALALKAAELIPKPPSGIDGKDGRDAEVDTAMLAGMVKEHVESAVAALPVPKDGKSVTVDELAPMVVSEVTKAVAAIPTAKDGVGVVGALLDRDGHLVVTLSDGQTKDVGLVVGRDVDMAEVAKTIASEVAKIPTPKDGTDGKDGLGFEDMTFATDEHDRLVATFTRGEVTKSVVLPGIYDKGVYREGTHYLKGSGVTWGGSFWIAQADTTDKPGEGKTDWRLAVKKGADGKAGKDGIGKPGRDGKDFTPPPDRRPF